MHARSYSTLDIHASKVNRSGNTRNSKKNTLTFAKFERPEFKIILLFKVLTLILVLKTCKIRDKQESTSCTKLLHHFCLAAQGFDVNPPSLMPPKSPIRWGRLLTRNFLIGPIILCCIHRGLPITNEWDFITAGVWNH